MEFGRVFDREIPVRSAIDFDYANLQLTTANDSAASSSSSPPPSRWGPYREILGKVLFNDRTKILAFNNNNVRSSKKQQEEMMPSGRLPQSKRWNLYSPDDIVDTPGLADDENLNLLDWGPSNCIALAIGNRVYLRIVRAALDMVIVPDDVAPVTSISWAPDGIHMAVGLNNSQVQLWDITYCKLLTTLRGVHRRGSRVGSLAWNGLNILTTGGADGSIVDTDPRLKSSNAVVHTYRGGHCKEICGLKWSCDSGRRQLASGGSDGLVHIWDSRNQSRWKFRFTDHAGAGAGAGGTVRALAWCPFRDHLLATGGGDGSVKFWSAHTGTCINSLQTGRSQVCALLWSKNKQQLLTSRSGNQDQLTLWEYPSVVKTGQLVGHTSRALYLAQSPDGRIVASASGGANDETLKFWNVFPHEPKKEARGPFGGPFGGSNRTQIRGMSSVHAIFITVMSVYLVFFSDLFSDNLPGGLIITRSSNLSTFVLGVSVGYFITDLTMMFWTYPILGGKEYVFHHVLSVVAVAYSMFSAEGQLYTCLVLISEATTPAVNLRWFLDTAGMKRSIVYLVNGVMLFLGWLVARILLFSYLFYHVYLHHEEVKQMHIYGYLLVFGVPSALGIMNMIWFAKILKGLRKTWASSRRNI